MNQQNSPCDITGIDQLNDNCLMHLFSFLPIIDRIRIERVSKRWRSVSRMSWKSLKCINITEYSWGIDADKNEIVIDRRILRKVLRRCGPFITHVDLSREQGSPPYCLPNRIVRIQSCRKIYTIIHDMCPNIKFINMGHPCAESAIEYVANNYENLTHFIIHIILHDYENDVSLLFSKCRKLKYVEMESGSCSGKCLLNLNLDSIEELHLECVSLKSPENLEKALQRFSNLKTLSIRGCDGGLYKFLNTFLISICTNADNLKVLDLYFSVRTSSFFDYSCMAKLKNLKKLYVNGSEVANDDVLKVVGSNCTKLTNLHISDSHLVTNAGIAGIANLPQLQYLYIYSLNNVTDIALSDILSLKELVCRSCPNIKDEGLASLIYASRNIELIKLYDCQKISNKYLINLAAYSALSKLKVIIHRNR